MLAALPCAGCFSAYIAGQGAYVSELPLADAPARAGGEGVLYGGIGVARRDSAGGFGGNVRVRVTDGVGGGDGGIHAYGIEPIAAFGRDEPNGSLSAWGRAAAWVGGSGYGFRWSHTLEGGLLFCPDAHTTTPVAVGNVRLGMRHDTSGLCATLEIGRAHV